MPTQVFYRGKGFEAKYVGVKFSTLARRGDIASKNAVAAAAEWTKREAQTLVPWKTGDLSRTARAGTKKTFAGSTEGLPASHKGRNVAIVTFGNSTIRYAIIQHEGDFYHKNGRIKWYLKVALQRANSQQILNKAMADRIAMIGRIQSMPEAPAP